MDIGAGLLRPKLIRRRPADEERAIEVDADHAQPILRRHLVEDHVAQDARIVDDDVHLAERVHGALHDPLGGRPFGDAVGADDGLAAPLLDDLFGLFRRGCGQALSRQRRADVIDHDIRARQRHGDGDLPPDAATGAGNDRDFAF